MTRLRGLVDKLERSIRLQMRAKPEDRAIRKHEVNCARFELLKAISVIVANTARK